MTIVCGHGIFVLQADNGEVRKMRVNIQAIEKLAEVRGWSTPVLAEKVGVEYSYLFRILNGKKNGGAKLFVGLFKLCKQENLKVEDYIFLNESLSTDNIETA